MQADWEFEVGGDAPVIDACWDGLVDLRADPELAYTLPEAANLPALATCLAQLNGPASPVWTAKCDFWPVLDPADFDADELDAPTDSAAVAMACYIDILDKDAGAWSEPSRVQAKCQMLCSYLQQDPVRCCRVDLVIRRAVTLIAGDQQGYGITAYLTACGATPASAMAHLSAALGAFAAAICPGKTLQ